jgi:hypothetical protein
VTASTTQSGGTRSVFLRRYLYPRFSSDTALLPFLLQALIGDVDCILVSNSYWIEETRPCITYGLRGVVHVSIEISSDKVCGLDLL